MGRFAVNENVVLKFIFRTECNFCASLLELAGFVAVTK
jgi:hypothetical protein